MDNKKGISLIVLIVTITIAIILAVAVTVTLDNGIKNSRVNSFIYEISTVEDAVKSYYTMNNELPSDDSFKDKSADEAGANYNLSIDEMKENGDENSTFFLVDMKKIEAESEVQKSVDKAKKFICAYPSFNIYSSKGISVNGKKYYSITEKLDDLVNRSGTGTSNNTSEISFESRSKFKC